MSSLKKTIPKQIKQHNDLTQARYSLSATELDIFFSVLSQITEESTQYDQYIIDIGWLEEVSGKKLNTSQLMQATKRMLGRVYTFPREDGKGNTQVSLLSSADHIDQERKIVVSIDPKMGRYLFDLKSNFTIYYLEYALRLQSKFSKRIYQMLSQFRSTGYFKTSIREIKIRLELIDEETGTEKYQKVSAFKKYVLDTAQKELEETDIQFNYNLIKRGRSYQLIEFSFDKHEYAPNDALKNHLKEKPRDYNAPDPSQPIPTLHAQEQLPGNGSRSLYQRLTEDFKLSHQQILHVFESIPDIKVLHRALYDLKNLIRDKTPKNIGAYSVKCLQNVADSKPIKASS